tara:strand:+ start:477 stop:935 length:459 start_codon:yes stop_codon:yes gene_type:complete
MSIELIHSGLSTSDLDMAVTFYTQAFGFKVMFRENNITHEIELITGEKKQSCSLAQLSLPGSAHIIELLQFHGYETKEQYKPKVPLRPGQGHIAFNVKNFDSWIKKLKNFDAQLLGDVTDFPEGRAAYFIEPSGTFFEIAEASAPQGEIDAS